MKKSRIVAYVLLLYVFMLIPGYYLTHIGDVPPTRMIILEFTPLYALILLILILIPAIAVGLIVWIIKHNKRKPHATDR